MSLSPLNYTTHGLYPNLPSYGPLLTNGAPITLNPTPKFNDTENPAKAVLGSRLNLSATQLKDLQNLAAVLRNTDGTAIVPSQTGFLPLGTGYSLGFDTDTLQGRVSPLINPTILSGNTDPAGHGTSSYTGSNLLLVIDLAEPAADGKRHYKQLLEATTITVSVHREVAPVRASGYINPKGFALGTRTIAGTLILTQFTTEVLFSFLQSSLLVDGSKDTFFTKIDQIPPFNITMVFTNESGYASQRKLLGVKFVTDGIVYSIQDMLTEQTLSWMATDFTPLMPMTLQNMYAPSDPYDPTTRRERSVADAMRGNTYTSPRFS